MWESRFWKCNNSNRITTKSSTITKTWPLCSRNSATLSSINTSVKFSTKNSTKNSTRMITILLTICHLSAAFSNAKISPQNKWRCWYQDFQRSLNKTNTNYPWQPSAKSSLLLKHSSKPKNTPASPWGISDSTTWFAVCTS